ncbi:hypothetical protein [Mycobacterium sp.]|uniref:hypothetical protein n=1 Tax=Mycobacterium sp. TaxID=1785 RepID=UPI003F969EC7
MLAWLTWCREQGHTAPTVPVRIKRSTPPDSDTPVRSRIALDRLIARRDIHVREKTLWRMLYETCARAEELLQVNIEDLDLAARCCPVKSKGAKPRTRRRGATHAEYQLDTVYWDAGAGRLLPRLIRDRTRGPLFVGHRKPAPGTAVGDRDVCPDTGPRAAVLRTGPRPARRRDRHRRTRHRLGSARAAPLRPHAPRRSGASLLSSWPNRATANPRTCADTSNPHPQPYGGSPACLDQEPTGADTQSLMYLVTRFLTTPLLSGQRCSHIRDSLSCRHGNRSS